MKLLLLITLLNSFPLFAGDGGFDQYTCSSLSGRTSLIYVKDNFSEAAVPNKVSLVIDGYFVHYSPRLITEGEWEQTNDEENITSNFDWKHRELTFYQGESLLLKVIFQDNNSYIVEGSSDPRPDKNKTPKINLNCKHFYKGP